MSENLTWKDENGVIMTKATKTRLAERLYKLETFLRLCLCCDLEKYHVSICARQMKSPHVTRIIVSLIQLRKKQGKLVRFTLIHGMRKCF